MSEQEQQVEVGQQPTAEEQEMLRERTGAAPAQPNGQDPAPEQPEAEPAKPNGQAGLKDFLPEDEKKASEELIMGKYKTYEDLEEAHKSLEKKLGMGESGPGLSSPEAYLDEKTFDAAAFAKETGIDADIVQPGEPVMQAFAKLAHENGLAPEKHQAMLKGLLGIMSDQMGVPLSQEAAQKTFHARLEDTLGKNYAEVIGQTARYVENSLKPKLTTQGREIIDRLGQDPDGVLLLREIANIQEGKASQRVKTDAPGGDGLPTKRDALMKELESRKARNDPEYKQQVVDQLHAISGKGA